MYANSHTGHIPTSTISLSPAKHSIPLFSLYISKLPKGPERPTVPVRAAAHLGDLVLAQFSPLAALAMAGRLAIRLNRRWRLLITAPLVR
jgi:hypothetical protein